MESARGSTAVDSGSRQHAARRSRRRWVMVLALLGFGAGALAPVAGLAGGDGEWRHEIGMPEPDQRRSSRLHAQTPAESEARMHPGSGLAAGGAGVSEERYGGIEAIPMPAMHLLHSLRAARYARECGSHRRLCALIAAHHARTGIGPVAWKRTGAPQAVISEAKVTGMQDAAAASYAVIRAQGQTPRTRRPDEG